MNDANWPGPDSRPAILTVARPAEAGRGNTVFGGWIMAQFDHAAGRAGRGIAGQCVIRAVQEMQFHAALPVGSDFAVHAREISRGRTSFTLELVGLANPDHAPVLIATARFIMVAIDEQGGPRALVA
ncbi:acyl-CoA thioesterase [Paracoccus aestuariivivens]|uniref:Acyl-CoA thioesterase n=1 Tax=Paracoccus aestuariivivens TaxID=1820333 RepID=A0A6L6JCY7_9RHOB|nr:acyl-CoA thioesterase [Paracoccus aestuariivivens]MTH79972.1 acyl-CoA thioesterase [Paracoccus aestuariivivens]